MNEQGVCIRPVINRSSFVNDAGFQNTTLVLATNDSAGNSNVIFGAYDPQSLDLGFSQSVGLTGGEAQEVALVDASQRLFLLAQDERAGLGVNTPGTCPPGSTPLEGLSALSYVSSQVGASGPFVTCAPALDNAPEGSVFKTQYTSDGLMYMLGAPRSNIFVARFNAGLVGPTNNPVGLTFDFLQPAYSVAGNTDPFYVGLYGTFSVNGSTVSTATLGAVQAGLDVNTTTEPPITTTRSQALNAPSGAVIGLPYVPGRPIDPVPQILLQASDVSSRGFVTQALSSTSVGYVLAGANPDALDSAIGLGLAVRYLKDDPGPTSDPPTRPAIQALTNIDLNFGTNLGDTRLARFDVQAATGSLGPTDTIYVFGSDGLTASGPSDNTGPVLTFVSEGHVYGSQTLSYGFSVSTDGQPTTAATRAFTLTTLNEEAAFQALANDLKALIQAADSTASVVFDAAYYIANKKFRIDVTSSVGVYLLLRCDGPTQASFAAFFGFDVGLIGTDYTLVGTPFNGTLTGTTPQSSASNFIRLISEYNGLSWDDNGDPNTMRPVVKAMPVGLGGGVPLTGHGLSAWSFDPVSQSLAFAVGGAPIVSTTAGISRQTFVYDHTGSLQRFMLPANCIDLEVHLWGAGGSSDAHAGGTGGAGAYVGGHLDASEWATEGFLDVLVGSGGSGSLGGGGVGAPGGSGGGRSALLKSRRDVVSAGGGGGSTGLE